MNMRCALLLAAVCAPCWAQAAPAAESSKAPAEPEVRHIVIQGHDTRIEELRVRGQTRRITVTPKAAGGTSYDVIPADGLRDLPDEAGTTRGAAGKRVWHVLNF